LCLSSKVAKMPTITCGCKQLFDALDIPFEESFSAEQLKTVDEEFDLLCFSYGIENDGVTELEDKRRAFKIDVPANRYDLLCFEGLARALRVFLGKEAPPKFVLKEAVNKVIVHPSTRAVRPFVTCAILRNVSLTPDSYQSFLDLQDHLHRNICRRRTLVSVGTHDMDAPVAFPVRYEALPREGFKFRHLFAEADQQLTGRAVLDEFKSDPRRSHLKEYADIIYDKENYPVMLDANNQVLSLPPVINGFFSRMSHQTKNIFIECTACDLTKANIVLDIMVTMFARYCGAPESVEKVEVVYLGGIPKTVAAENSSSDGKDTVVYTPVLTERECSVSVESVNSYLGLALEGDRIASLLSKMQLQATHEGGSIRVRIPPTRADILHAVDLIEDVAIAYGFNDVPERFPPSHVPGKELPINLLSDLLRFEIAAAGYIEILTFGLCTRASNFEEYGRVDDSKTAVTLANPKTAEYQIARTTLVPGLLKTLQEHKAEQTAHGLKLFEISDVVVLDPAQDTGARNIRRLSALYTGNTAGFEIVHGLLDRVMQLCNVVPSPSYSKDGAELAERLRGRNATRAGEYAIVPFDGSRPSTSSGAGAKTFFPGRGASIMWTKPSGEVVEVGTMGIIHPDVLEAFEIKNPVSALEITLDDFVPYA
jgi:phenylalanyl-tRNA synthetase beta chain